jgi:hypothetical protein
MARHLAGSVVLLIVTCVGQVGADPVASPSPPLAGDAAPWTALPLLPFPDPLGKIQLDEPDSLAWLDSEQGRHPQKVQTEGLLGSWTSQFVWIDPQLTRQNLLLESPWKTDEAWRMEVLGPLFLFGQLGAAPDPVAVEALKLNGRTGVGCKIPVGLGIEVQLRGGPALTYADPQGFDRGGEHSAVFVEVQCRCPLPGQAGLEFQGSAVPGLGPQEHDKLTQDLRLALPVGDLGKLQLGAKHQWESMPTAKPGLESMQLYLGFELGSLSHTAR